MTIKLELRSDDDLLPCPFCGHGVDSDALTLFTTGTACYRVRCRCGAEVVGGMISAVTPMELLNITQHMDAKKAAIAAWNTRTVNAEFVSLDELLTPAEVEKAQQRAVHEAMFAINQRLLAGYRRMSVPSGLETDIRDRLLAKGWSVENDPVYTTEDSVAFTLRPGDT